MSLDKPLTEEELEQVAGEIVGTCSQTWHITERLGLGDVDGFAVEDQLLDLNIERCKGCDWWFNSCMLDEEGFCADCQEGSR